MSDRLVTLDVRDDIRAGREPFSHIMATVAELGIGQALLLIVPFEPVPLYSILERRGFAHESRPIQEGHWEVLFSRIPTTDSASVNGDGSGAVRPSATSASCSSIATSCVSHLVPTVEVDARGLEPPQPLVTILEALANLPESAELRAHTDRRPMHLYAHLEQRGFAGETEAQADGSFVTVIRRFDCR